jgi:hypothetical protein
MSAAFRAARYFDIDPPGIPFGKAIFQEFVNPEAVMTFFAFHQKVNEFFFMP